MSQAKVDQYKKEKANRKEALAKEKRQNTLIKICGGAVVVVLAAWIGVSTVDFVKDSRPVKKIYCQTGVIDEYIDALYAETEATE